MKIEGSQAAFSIHSYSVRPISSSSQPVGSTAKPSGLETLIRIEEVRARANDLKNLINSELEFANSDAYVTSLQNLLEMMKKFKQPSYLQSLKNEFSEISRATLDKVEALLENAQYSNLIKPEVASQVRSSLERLITANSLEKLPEQIEEIWNVVTKLRKDLIQIAKSLELKREQVLKRVEITKDHPEVVNGSVESFLNAHAHIDLQIELPEKT
ncbi:MAG: hypothetical protein NZO16_02500 [Deltaproteobacteria bacterium]|nr:hypothetical protein [Deltaproteobacteria bacterium]